MTRRTEVDNRLWHDAWQASVAGGCALFVASVAAGWVQLRTAPLMTGAAVAAVLAIGSTLIRTGSLLLGGYTAAWAALVIGWFAYSRFGDPWQTWPLVGLVCACFTLGPAGAIAVARWNEHLQHMAASELARLDAGERRRYERIFTGLSCPVEVTEVGEDRSGTIVHIRLPAKGHVTILSLEQAARGVEVALGAKAGTVQFVQGASARDVIMRQRERDILAEPVPMPMDLTPLTVNEPLRVGLTEAGTEYKALFREVCTLAAGQRGAGKSNLANVLIAQFGRCVDVLIFLIDLKQGRMAGAWVQPWAREETPRPAVDWVATSRPEVERMLLAMQAAGNARADSRIGGAKHTPTREHPAIMLITDETAVIFGPGGPAFSTEPGAPMTNRRLAEVAGDIVNRFRSECIDMVLFALRATVDMAGGGHLKPQCKLRFGLGVQDEAEARYLLEDQPSVSRWLSRMKHPGSGIAQWGKEEPVILKYDQLEDPAVIAEVAKTTWRYRPEPDPVMAEAMGEAWADRWANDEAQTWLAKLRQSPAGNVPAGATATLPRRPKADLPDVLPEFQDLLDAGVMGDDPEASVDDRHLRLRQIIIARGASGVTPAWLERLFAEDEKAGKGKAPARGTLMRWLREDCKTGIITQAGHGRYRTPPPPR